MNASQKKTVESARRYAERGVERIRALLEDSPDLDGQKLIDALDTAASDLSDAAQLLENIEVDA